MPFDTFDEIMTYAIEKEKEAAQFYEDLSRRESAQGVKELFHEFADEERRHRRMLENFSHEQVDRYSIRKIPDLKRSDYLVDLQYVPDMAYADILRLAMKREEKAHAFYRDFAAKTAEAEHRKLFEMLAQEEAKHKLRLETMLDDYLAAMGD